MATATDRSVEIEDLGCIKRAEFVLPEKGILELVGQSGIGKSLALQAIAGAINQDNMPTVRDGADKGFIRIGGLRVTVGRRSVRKGESDIRSIESDFCLDEFVNGGNFQDPEAADARRVEVIVRLLKATVDSQRFKELIDDASFERLVKSDDLDGDDLVAIQKRIKRRFEAGKRQAEAEAENCRSRARAKATEAEGVDLHAEHDEAKLRETHTAAVQVEAELRTKAKSARDALDKAADGRDVLKAAETAYDGLSIDDAVKAQADALDAATKEGIVVDGLKGQIEALQRQLENQMSRHREALQVHNAAMAATNASRNHFANLDKWRQAIDAAANVEAIPAEALADAASAVSAAQQAIEQGAIIRKAKRAVDESTAETVKARGLEEYAEKLDRAAKGTEEILSEVVASSGVPLKIKQARMYADHDGQDELFARLSHGERTIRGLALMINAVRGMPDAVITCGQELWASLGPALKAECIRMVEDAGACMVTIAHGDNWEIQARTLNAEAD